jgi:hypothetical protein
MADDINLPNLISHLEVNLADTSGIVASAAQQGSSVGAALGQSMRQQIQRAVDEIPEVEINGDSTDLDRDVDRVRRELLDLANTRIGVDISVEEALRRMAELEPHLDRIEHSHPNLNITASVAGARADLEEIRLAAARVDDDDVDIDVHVDTARPIAEVTLLSRALSRIGDTARSSIASALSSLAQIGGIAGAGIPAIAGLVATLQNIAPAAFVGVSAILAVASAAAAVKIGTSGVGDAISAAFAPVTGGGGGGGGGSAGAAAAAIRAVADAQRNLKDVTQQAAYSNAQAMRRVQDATRDLADAQKDALQAQRDLVAAEKDATRQLEDQNNRLIDAKNAERDAVFDVQDAEEALAKTKEVGSKASLEDQAKAQLALDKAKQQLAEQQLEVRRLQADTDAANKAGVSGSDLVVQAQERVTSSTRDVADRQRDVSDAQSDVARTAAQGAEAIDRATEALKAAGETASGGSSGGAAGGIDAFAAAMAKLSPSAQAFVREIIALKPAFDSLKLDVQERLFAGLAGELDSTAHVLLPIFRKSLDDSADSLNLAAKGAAAAARGIGRDGTLGQALAGANKGLANLVPIPGQLVKALGQIGAAAAPAFDRVTKAATRLATELSEKVDKAFKSGELEKSINLAVDLIGQLFGVAGNLIKILTNIFAPAVADGTNFIGVLQDITGQLAKATGAKGFQDAMSALFGVIGEIGKVGGPLLLKALAAVEPVLTHLGPPAERLVDALGAALGPILDALAPLLVTAADGVGALTDAALPLLPVVSDLIAGLGPSLQPILDDLVGLFVDLEPVVQDLADALSLALAPILASLPALVGPFADLVARNLTVALVALGQILVDNAPALAELGVDLANLFIAAGPLITAFTQLSTAILIKATPAFIAVLDAATRFGAYLTGVFSGVINQIIIPALHILTDLLHGRFGAAWDEARDHATGALGAVLRAVTGFPGAVASALAPLAGKVGRAVGEAAGQLTVKIADGVDKATRTARELPGLIAGALGDLSSTLYKSGRSLIAGVIDGIRSKISDAKDAVSGILGAVADHFPHSPAKVGPFSGRGWTRFSGEALMDDWGGGMLAALPGLLGAVNKVVGGAAAGLAGGLDFAAAVPSGGALAATYAGSAAPMSGPTTINLYGTEATPEGVSQALAWRSKVGRP